MNAYTKSKSVSSLKIRSYEVLLAIHILSKPQGLALAKNMFLQNTQMGSSNHSEQRTLIKLIVWNCTLSKLWQTTAYGRTAAITFQGTLAITPCL